MNAQSAAPARAELVASLFVLWTLVVLRSAVYVRFEHAFFESDQAIIGLMAKHLIEGQALPLFYYGQTYMLGVDAWMAAPFFWLFGSSVTTLHLSVLVSNLLAAMLLFAGLVRHGGLRPRWAVLALVFFAFAPPVTARSLIEAGANIGVFVYVPLLWFLRRHPIGFGVVFALGVLHREFTLYALPSLAVAELATGVFKDRERLVRWLVAVVVAAGTWQAVQALKPYSDLMGPGTRGQLIDGVAGSQLGNMAGRASFDVADLPRRLTSLAGDHLPGLFGLTRVTLADGTTQGRAWVWPVALVLLLGGMGGAWRDVRARRVASPFGWYLVGTGLTAAAAYAATRPSGELVQRYVLLTLFLPAGAAAVAMAGRTGGWARNLVAVAIMVWVGASALDHVTFARRYVPTPPSDETRMLVDALVARGVHVAEASYWRAYKLTFVAGERLVVASTDVQRIQAYRRKADEAGSALVRIQEQPCNRGGEQIGRWYLCPSQ